MTSDRVESKLKPDEEFSVRFRPEIKAGGYANDDSTVEFYQRIVSVLPEQSAVLDLGAGRGAMFIESRGAWKNWLVRLGGRASRRVGADIDESVRDNPGLDEAVVLELGKPLPFDSESFDLILCDWVLEHIDDTQAFLSEVRRVLKVGGWFCARTPNKFGYLGVGTRIVPNSMEGKVLKWFQPNRAEHDIFPKLYKLNSVKEIGRVFNSKFWRNASYTYNPSPSYHGQRTWAFRLIESLQRLMPNRLKTLIFIFAQRIE